MNNTLYKLTLTTLLSALCLPVHALGLSDVRLNSVLNQRLDATIDILSASPQELDNLNITISRLGNQTGQAGRWPEVTVKLIRPESGKSFIQLSSKETVREPVLEFLLELSWSTGRILREYSLFIDPRF